MGYATILFRYIFIVWFNNYVLSDCAEIMSCYLGSNPHSTATWLNTRMGCKCISNPTLPNPYGTKSCICPGVANKTLCCTAKMTALFSMQPQDLSECATGLGIMVDNMRDACSEPDVNPKCVVSPTFKQCINHIEMSDIIIMVIFAVLSTLLLMRSSIKLSNFKYNLLPDTETSTNYFKM